MDDNRICVWEEDGGRCVDDRETFEIFEGRLYESRNSLVVAKLKSRFEYLAESHTLRVMVAVTTLFIV